jgi:16S rRNA (cytosine967-C5)-methyltransferase
LVAAGWQAERHPHAPDALRIEPAADVRTLPGFAAGHVSVQDAAAQLAVELLAPQPGERILDACAAPGGKTCHILERVGGPCHVTALDVSAARLDRVHENLARLGLSADVRAGDLAAPSDWWDGQAYDRILLDVPCSATGVIRRHPDIKLLRRASDIPPLARRQRDLLRAAWGLLAPGGTLLYTSCSVLWAENEAVVAGFLRDTTGAEDRTALLTQGWGPGAAGSAGPGYLNLPGAAGMDGFYYACLVRPA